MVDETTLGRTTLEELMDDGSMYDGSMDEDSVDDGSVLDNAAVDVVEILLDLDTTDEVGDVLEYCVEVEIVDTDAIVGIGELEVMDPRTPNDDRLDD